MVDDDLAEEDGLDEADSLAEVEEVAAEAELGTSKRTHKNRSPTNLYIIALHHWRVFFIIHNSNHIRNFL